MSDASSVFKGKLQNNNVEYELYALEGFSGMSEIALKVEGQIVYVLTLNQQRTGNIVCKPSKAKEILIKRDVRADLDANDEGPEPLTMDGIAAPAPEELPPESHL